MRTMSIRLQVAAGRSIAQQAHRGLGQLTPFVEPPIGGGSGNDRAVKGV